MKVLGLRIYGSYDLPKGKIEEGESILEAALRETEEEAGITDLDFRWGKDAIQLQNTGRRKKVCTVFVAETTQDPNIRPNPETGEYEHHGFKWLTFPQAAKKLHTYLRPAVSWAQQKMSLKESASKRSAKVWAQYRTDLDLALNWARLNEAVNSCGDIKKDGLGYSSGVSLKISKADFEYLMKERFGYFIEVR